MQSSKTKRTAAAKPRAVNKKTKVIEAEPVVAPAPVEVKPVETKPVEVKPVEEVIEIIDAPLTTVPSIVISEPPMTMQEVMNLTKEERSGIVNRYMLSAMIRHESAETLVRRVSKGSIIPNAIDDCGNTPLDYAIEYKRADMVKALLENGADPNFYDEEHSYLAKAIRMGKGEIVELLCNHDAEVDLDELVKASREVGKNTLAAGLVELQQKLVDAE